MTARPRTIVTADPELDDLNSMIRLLLYSNEIEIAGLVYASSRYHWKGDGAGTTRFFSNREYTEPQSSWRWAPGERFIDEVIDAYAEVHDNLVVHDSRYPTPGYLRSVVREGNVNFEGDVSEETAGSNLIADILLDGRPDPVHLQAWAGTSTIARALMTVERRHRHSPQWDTIKAEVSRKAVITKFDSQDGTYDDYIRPEWPHIRVTDAATWAWGYSARQLSLSEYQHMLSSEWMRQYVTSIGPLGRLYRTWGDGRRMVETDPTDFFHLSGHTADELEQLGYHVWTDVQPAGEWISEGDTTTMLNLIGNGLRAHEHPTYGGWGGRATRTEEPSDEWNVRAAVDRPADGREAHEYTVTRWFAAAQRDFAERLRWSISPTFDAANHHPVVDISPSRDIRGEAGQSITVAASATDPDGDDLRFTWWQYHEAGTCTGEVKIADAHGTVAVVTLPDEAAAGDTVHLILEVTDGAEHPLTTYARVIITIT